MKYRVGKLKPENGENRGDRRGCIFMLSLSRGKESSLVMIEGAIVVALIQLGFKSAIFLFRYTVLYRYAVYTVISYSKYICVEKN